MTLEAIVIEVRDLRREVNRFVAGVGMLRVRTEEAAAEIAALRERMQRLEERIR
jgi:hypothetical protein